MSDSTSDVVITATRPPLRDPNEVTVTVGGYEFGGWQDVRIERGVERMPNSFELGVTERYPGQLQDVVIQPGTACKVQLGNTRVVTGWIDTYAPSISPAGHQVRITGRGLCEDLVDCSAAIAQAQIGGGSVVSLIEMLAKPFGISVTVVGGVGQQQCPIFALNLGETPFEIMDKVARWAQLLVYEDPYGGLVLAQVGSDKAASGFEQGVNVLSAAATFSMTDRFSIIQAVQMSVERFADFGTGGNNSGVAYDKGVGPPRYRPKIIVSEQTQNGQDIAQKRCNWEVARRYGRSQAIQLVTDTWRDSDGDLWTPNTLVDVDVPVLKVNNATWVIGEVSYLRGDSGTSCALTLMPAAAYQPEPNILLPFDWQVSDALPKGAGT